MSEINEIRRQFLTPKNWPQFLASIEINGLRGLKGQKIEFDFPIVAIIGENGSGKSTFLKAAACAYNNKYKIAKYYPGIFFKDTIWDKIENVYLSYYVRTGDAYRSFQIKKGPKRWRFPEKRVDRSVYFFDISRLMPIDSKTGAGIIAQKTLREVSSEDLTSENCNSLSYVLGCNYNRARFVTPDSSLKSDVKLLEQDFGQYSEFHQGTGESAVLGLFKFFQTIPEFSLLIIDEVESSLHPKAQRQIMKILLKICRIKKIQIILSSHSHFILSELPPEARILLLKTSTGLEIIPGVSPDFALSKLDNIEHPELHIFTEDRNSVIMLREIIYRFEGCDELLPRIQITPIGGDSIIKTIGLLGMENKLPFKSLAVLDGDMNDSPGCIKLPGGLCPEKVVFLDLKEKQWENLSERFGIGAGTLHTILNDAIISEEFHLWPNCVGDHIHMGGISVWEILVKEWCRSVLTDEQRDAICREIQNLLNT